MSEVKDLKLSKCSLQELNEILIRQNSLINHKSLMNRLKDKGESILKTRDKVLAEIEHRKNIDNLEHALVQINLNSDSTHSPQEKHIEYVCSKETLNQQGKFKPYQSSAHLNKILEPVKSSDCSKKIGEVTAASEPKLLHKPAKVIPLSESLIIQQQQAQRIMDRQTDRLMEQLLQDFLEDSNEIEDTDKETASIDLDEHT